MSVVLNLGISTLIIENSRGDVEPDTFMQKNRKAFCCLVLTPIPFEENYAQPSRV